MQDTMTLLMLVCAIAASLAFGVLAAHSLCRAAFVLLKMHASSLASKNAGESIEVSVPS